MDHKLFRRRLLILSLFGLAAVRSSVADEPADAPKLPTRSAVVKMAENERDLKIHDAEARIKEIKSGKARIPVAQRKAAIIEQENTITLLQTHKLVLAELPRDFKLGSFGDARVSQGWSTSPWIERVLDSDHAIIRLTYSYPGGHKSDRKAVLKIPTKGLADNSACDFRELVGVSDTLKVNGETLFVLEPLKD